MAHFSPFHFQRIFKAEKGVSPKQYIKRLRLELAAHIIVLYPEKSMLAIALDAGFKSLETFSRAFKNYYFISPLHYQKLTDEQKIKVLQNSLFGKEFLDIKTPYLISSKPQSTVTLSVEVVKLGIQRFVCLETKLADSALIQQSFRDLKHWCKAQNIFSEESSFVGLIKDFPLFTALEDCRYTTCISVKEELELSGMFRYVEIAPTKYASFVVKGGNDELIEAVSYFARVWLPTSGYEIVHEPALQFLQNDPLEVFFDQYLSVIYIRLKSK